MQYRIPKLFLNIVIVGSLLLSLVACTAVQPAPAADAQQPPPVKLTIWHLAVDTEPFINVFQRWAEKTGNEVELIAIPSEGFENATLTRWAAGERPDIMEYHGTSGFTSLNPEANIQDLSGMDFVGKAPNLYPALATINGKTYGAITSFPQVFGMYYNKAVFAAAGIEEPQNMDEVMAACETLKGAAPGVIPIWENGGSFWPPQVLPTSFQADRPDSFEQDVLDKKTTLDDPNGPYVASLAFYDTLHKNGCFNETATTDQFEDGIKAVAEGRAAMIWLPPFVDFFNNVLGDAETTDNTIGFAYPSSQSSRAWWIPNPQGTYYAPKTGDAAREAAALDFIRYATSEGYQQTLDEAQMFPVFEGYNNPADAQALTVELKEAFDDNSRAPGIFPEGIDFATLMQTLLAEQATPLEVAQQAQLQLAQGAKAAGIPGWE